MRSALSFLALLVTALSAVFGVSSAYAASQPSGIVSASVGGYCFVTSDGKVYSNGSYVLSSETGFSSCAYVRNFGACWLKPDWTLKCANGFERSSVKSATSTSMGASQWEDELFLNVVYLDGTSYFYYPNGNVRIPYALSGFDFARPIGSYGAYCTVNSSGVANFYRYYADHYFSFSDAVDCAWWDPWSSQALVLKSDGTLGGNVPNLPTGNYVSISQHWNVVCALSVSGVPVCFSLSDGSSRVLVSNAPAYPVRNLVIYNPNLYDFAPVAFAVRVSDSMPVTWSDSVPAAPVSSAPASSWGASNSSEYCIESPTSSGSYVFTPLNTYWPVTTDSSFFGWWESFSTSAIDYKFFHVDFEYRQYLTGALLNTNTVEAFSFVSSDMAPVFDASVEIVSKSGSVNYLRVFGDTHWNPVEYSAILEDSDWNRTYKVAYTRTDMGKYLMYEGSWNVVWWRLRFPDFDTDVTVKRFEIGNREYVSSSVTRVTCYPKEEYDQIKNYGTGSSYTGATLGSIWVWMSTYVGIQNGGSWTWTNGELYERVFSGSQDYLNTNPPENYTKIVSTYFTKCEAPEADLGGFSFLSWWFEWTVPVVNYSFDFRPFVGVECPLRVVVANYETLKWLLYNR